MVSRRGRGKHVMRRFTGNLLLILVGVICVSLFSSYSLAEGKFRARDGKGWSLTADGVLTIENNAGWQDYLMDGASEVVNKLVIGKKLTDFSLFNSEANEYVDNGMVCPRFQPKQIVVEDGNPTFVMKEGLLIDTMKRIVTSSEMSVQNVVIPEGIREIGAFAFYNRREIDAIQFPSTLKKIGAFAFSDCTNLEALDFPNTLDWIGDYAFYECSGVKEVRLSNELQYIGEYAFYLCSTCELILPDNVQEIGSGCFEGSQQLETVRWPANLKTISYQIFKDCTNLQTVDLPEGLETIGAEAFLGCENLTQITLPSTLTTIGDDAFHGCEKLMDVMLPKSLQEIGSGAFFSTDFSLIEFSKTVKVGSYAFGYVYIAVFSGSENEFGKRFIRSPGEFVFLGTPPRNFPKYIKDDIHQDMPQVFYTEPYADAWKPIAEAGLNGWPTQCISVEEAQTRIAQAGVPTPEPTADEVPWATDAILGMHISTPEPHTQPDQPAADTKTDPLVYMFVGLLALVVVGIVVVGIKTRKQQHGKSVRKG